MDISRRLVVCSRRARGRQRGSPSPQLLARADDPDLAPPLRLRTVETDPSTSPPAAPRDPVPVVPLNDRADDAVRGGDDDDDDGPGDDEPNGDDDVRVTGTVAARPLATPATTGVTTPAMTPAAGAPTDEA